MISEIADSVVRRVPPAGIAALCRKVPPALLRRLAADRFRRTVRWAAARSPFYRRAFQEGGINAARVRTPADLRSFFTTADDITGNPDDFLCAQPSIVFESSGTTGRNKQVYYSEQEMRSTGAMTAAGYFMMGLDKSDRVANAFDFSIWIPGMICHYGLMAAGIMSLAFGKVDPIEVYRRLDRYRFTAVLGEPTWLVRLTELAEQHGPRPLKLLIGAAEEMPPAAVGWMEKVWAPAKVKMTYGSVELGGALGFQPCERADGYHIDTADYWPEVLDPDEEGYGELVLTTLSRKTMPLIRYRTRDIVKIGSERCPCGMPFPLMSRLRGRRDEMVVASGGNLYPLMFEHILEPVVAANCDWQVVFRLRGVREVMEIHLETEGGSGVDLEERVRCEMAQQYPDLAKNLALGIFDMRLVTHKRGTLRAGRKLRRMLDLRYEHAPLVDGASLAQATPASL